MELKEHGSSGSLGSFPLFCFEKVPLYEVMGCFNTLRYLTLFQRFWHHLSYGIEGGGGGTYLIIKFQILDDFTPVFLSIVYFE